jgi:hypothetical protein
VAGIALVLVAQPVRATLLADPTALYAKMQKAYAAGTADGWGLRDQSYYYAAILNAGRAYSLQHPDDPAYGQLATLTVQIGAGLNYDPLINHDGAVWWVREAAVYVQKNGSDEMLVSDANQLLSRVNAYDDPAQLAAYADQDASVNLKNYPRDPDALLSQVEADWRAYVLTGRRTWETLAFARAEQPGFPLANLPTTWGPAFLAAAKSDDTRLYARAQAIPGLRVIVSVTSMPHDLYMSTLAPADEYFGPLGMSIIGIQNQMKHINYMLDYRYGNREAGDALQVTTALDDLHKVYPRDRDLPQMLLECYTMLGRMDAPEVRDAAAHVKAILMVEYQDTAQARQVRQSN